MRDYMHRRVTPPEWVTSPTWGPPPPCKQVLNTPRDKRGANLPQKRPTRGSAENLTWVGNGRTWQVVGSGETI